MKNRTKKDAAIKRRDPFSPINRLAVRFVMEWGGEKRVERILYDPIRKAFFMERTNAERMFSGARQLTAAEAFRWFVAHQGKVTLSAALVS